MIDGIGTVSNRGGTLTAPEELVRTTRAPKGEHVPLLLVAADGSRGASAALRVASQLASREGWRVEVVSVEESFVLEPEGFAVGAASLDDDDVSDTHLARVHRQIDAVAGKSSWEIHVRFGDVDKSIAAVALEHGASMIVMGLSRHHPARRLFAAETAARVARLAPVPVFAANAMLRHLPHIGVAAVDGSPSSHAAAKAAMSMLEPRATLYLVHVVPEPHGPDGRQWHADYEHRARHDLHNLERELALPGVTIISHVINGRPAEAVLHFATMHGADLIAVGSNRRSFRGLFPLGSVPAQLLRVAECSVLVSPPGV